MQLLKSYSKYGTRRMPAHYTARPHFLRGGYETTLLRKGPSMTQPNKNGRTLKLARAIARRKLKARHKRQNAAKFAARTGKTPPSA